MSQSKLVRTAGVVLYINGKAYAVVTGFRYDAATPSKPIMGLDSSSPYELAPTTSRISGSIQMCRQSGSGGLEGNGTVPGFADLPRGKYFSLSLVERGSDTQLFRADHCWCESQAWDVPIKGMMNGSMTFTGLTFNNESAS